MYYLKNRTTNKLEPFATFKKVLLHIWNMSISDRSNYLAIDTVRDICISGRNTEAILKQLNPYNIKDCYKNRTTIMEFNYERYLKSLSINKRKENEKINNHIYH